MLIDYVSTVSKGHLSQMWPVVKVVLSCRSGTYVLNPIFKCLNKAKKFWDMGRL